MTTGHAVSDTLTSGSSTSSRLSTYGAAAVASGVLGIVVGLVTIAWPHDVSVDQWSYPFPVGMQWVVSLVLVMAHLLSGAGFVGVLAANPYRSRRAARVALQVVVAGFVLLALAEFLSGAIGGSDVDSTAAIWVGTLFGIASLMTALGSIWAGVVIVREKVWTGLGAWMVLASGGVIILLVTPANISGDLVVRTLALILWSLTFIPLGRTIAKAG
jgi:hypothetical protein